MFVLNGEQVQSVVDGKNGLLAGVGENACIICMSTIRQAQLEQVAALCLKKNVAFVNISNSCHPALSIIPPHPAGCL